ncbi:hypothetical protein IFM61606_05300 [Aspergillus udagawae]|uniref:Uncharacterized protein n=1 Tax=Aspergillus udagawae TaxID=91492 RepID=A0ABQ1AN31_9EURO|nr:hypothetical protein IFM51744_04699 [Aspergillus udagawae]GFF84963.1 hypothetical protein IFM53868_04323 [Aspergillus udagawae]GFG03385.1 hypothetical protein IFM5058_01402 [Aspergillus udagawae]GFG25360.1 hypothetical protein IFM61606_05300 [Aspergillus udagawae]
MKMNMNFLSDNNNPSILDPPPPYTPSDACPTMPEPGQEQEPDTKQPLPPSSSRSEHTSSTLSPNRGIQIPSKHDYFTSGFAYPPFLANYDISPHHWIQFTHDLNEEVKLSPRQWATTVAKGVGVLALGGMMAGVLGAIPAVLVARKARRNREEMNLIVAASERPADTDSGFEGGSRLSRKVERWNETFFRPRGIMVRVDLPWEELDEMHGMEVVPTSRYGLSRRDEQAVREDASRKARIVIIPVDTDPSGSASNS